MTVVVVFLATIALIGCGFVFIAGVPIWVAEFAAVGCFTIGYLVVEKSGWLD